MKILNKEKLVLAYSGGLDASVILHWLLKKGYDVIPFEVDIGQEEDFENTKRRALETGASKFCLEDAKEELLNDFAFPSLRADAKYEGSYLLGGALPKPLIARRQIELAKREGIRTVSHGATGNQNDYFRFKYTYGIFSPELTIVTPWTDEDFSSQFKIRENLLEYALKHNLPVETTLERLWTTEQHLLHASYEDVDLSDPSVQPRDDMFKMTVSPERAPDKTTQIEIEFENGNPMKVENLEDGFAAKTPLDMVVYLNKLGGNNGIGRIDIVESNINGTKSRGVYESPGMTILHTAHSKLKKITVSRELMRLCDEFMPEYADLVYQGRWYSPEREVLQAFYDKAQKYVTGKVRLSLYKGNVL